MGNGQLGAFPGGTELGASPTDGASGGGGGGVTTVTASGPLASSGGANPNISLSGTVAVAKGGTGSTTAANARTALGLEIGTDVQAHTAALDAVSGTNTGDQTITLTGNVTGTGTGSFAATIANDAVTYAKMQNVSATDKVLGRSTAGSGDVEEISCTASGRNMIAAASAVAQAEILGSEIPTQGADLTDADATITIAGSAQRVLPAATLSAARVLTLGVSGSPVEGETIAILRRDATAFTYTIKDDAATTLIVLPASTKFAAYFRFTGTHFVLSGAIRIQ